MASQDKQQSENHVLRRIFRSVMMAGWLAALGLDLVSVGVVVVLGFTPVGIALAAFIHVLAAGASWGTTRWFGNDDDRASASWQAIMVFVNVPPIGALMSLFVVMTVQRRGKEEFGQDANEDVGEDEETNTTAGSLPSGTSIPELLALDVAVQPLVDVLRSDDLQMKAAAIDTATGLPSSSVAPILRGLLTAPEADLRFQASVGLSKLESQITASVANAQVEVRRHPGSVDSAHTLAKLYLNYAESGLLDSSSKAQYAMLALDQFQRIEALDNEQSTAIQRARACLAAKEYEMCLECLGPEVDRNDAEVLLIEMEALYDLGRYDEVKKRASSAVGIEYQDAKSKEVVEWWATAA